MVFSLANAFLVQYITWVQVHLGSLALLEALNQCAIENSNEIKKDF